MRNKFLLLLVIFLISLVIGYIPLALCQTATPTPTSNNVINFINSVSTNIMLLVYLIVVFLICCVIGYIWLLIRRKR